MFLFGDFLHTGRFDIFTKFDSLQDWAKMVFGIGWFLFLKSLNDVGYVIQFFEKLSFFFGFFKLLFTLLVSLGFWNRGDKVRNFGRDGRVLNLSKQYFSFNWTWLLVIIFSFFAFMFFDIFDGRLSFLGQKILNLGFEFVVFLIPGCFRS